MASGGHQAIIRSVQCLGGALSRISQSIFKNAAGTYTYLLESGLPPFVASLTHPMSSSDLSKPVVKTLELLMLAQAAECYWQKAVAGQNAPYLG